MTASWSGVYPAELRHHRRRLRRTYLRGLAASVGYLAGHTAPLWLGHTFLGFHIA